MEGITLGSDVTIGISAYGNAKVTRHCLNCLLDSVDGDLELILVNDCSPDDGETTFCRTRVASLLSSSRMTFTSRRITCQS